MARATDKDTGSAAWIEDFITLWSRNPVDPETMLVRFDAVPKRSMNQFREALVSLKEMTITAYKLQTWVSNDETQFDAYTVFATMQWSSALAEGIRKTNDEAIH